MLINIATAVPPYKLNQKEVAVEIKKRINSTAAGRFIDAAMNNSGIETRNFVVSDGNSSGEDNFYTNGTPTTEQRMVHYEKWSKKLVFEAVEKAFSNPEINAKDITRVITISCTGFFAPGLDYEIINKFNIPKNVKRSNIGFMGCAASIIGFSAALDALSSGREENILMVSTELCSIHLQFEPTRDNILANTVFADGSAAVIFSNKIKSADKAKLKLQKTRSILFDDSSKFMGWKIADTGFQMILSSELPKIILETASPELKNILKEFGVEKEEIKFWALHPGGRAILDALKNGMNFTEEQMTASRNVLRKNGNMSSASILFVIEEILNSEKINKGDKLCAVAFGPGLTMEVALFTAE